MLFFEEIRPVDFESFYADKSKCTVEMRAIKEYLNVRKTRQVPVDDAPEGFGLLWASGQTRVTY
jgi:hypothetical protein